MRIINYETTELFYNYSSDGDAEEFYDGMRYSTIIGDAEEIKAVYRSLVKAFERGVFSVKPAFTDFPKFNPNKFYGVEISWNGIEPYYTGINDDGSFQIIGETALIDILNIVDHEVEEDWEDSWDDGYGSNMPCDTTGYCSIYCPIYYRCNPE